jgi:trans-aconitate methyltransferase
MSSPQNHRWETGDDYESYMGRWSRLVAREVVAWLDLDSSLRWMDVGCGSGALTATILNNCAPQSVLGVDPSTDFINHARQQITDPRASFAIAGADDLPADPDSMDVVVSALALNFMPDPVNALAQFTQATKSGGTIALYVWDYAGRMEWLRYFWDVAIALDPKSASMDQAERFPICKPDALRDLFTHAGLQQVEINPLDAHTHFPSFDDYWSPFLLGKFPAPAYVAALTDSKREALRQRLKDTLPTNADGSIDLIARAWAIRGLKS